MICHTIVLGYYKTITTKNEDLEGSSFMFVLHVSCRWSKPPISKSSLEGFFLRLRLGKWEEGLGGTGYHMARISGKTSII